MNKLNCGIKILYPAFLIQAVGFGVIVTRYPSFMVPMTVGAFLIWFSIQVDILYQCWMYPAKYIEYNHHPKDWTDQYDVITKESGCGWEDVYKSEDYILESDVDDELGASHEDIEIDDDEDDDIIRPDLSNDVVIMMPERTQEEIMEHYKKIGEEYARQYKENLAKELERTGLSEQEYFKACFGDDVGRKLDDKVS